MLQNLELIEVRAKILEEFCNFIVTSRYVVRDLQDIISMRTTGFSQSLTHTRMTYRMAAKIASLGPNTWLDH